MSWLPLVQNKPAEWRKEPPYEYYWERNFQLHPLSGQWDVEELYDLQEDPLESRKPILNPKYASQIREMRDSLFDVLERTGGMNIPLQRKLGGQQNKRNPKKKNAADFPSELYRKQ